MEDQDKRTEEQEDVEAHKKRHNASEESTDETENDADFELHKKHHG